MCPADMAMLEETDRYIATVRDFLHRVEAKPTAR
jgi:hypothetical protein